MTFKELVNVVKSKVSDMRIVTETKDEFEFELNTSDYRSVKITSAGILTSFRKDAENDKVVHFYSNNTFDNIAHLFEEGNEIWKLI